MSRLRVIVVEDSPHDAHLLLRALRQAFDPVEFAVVANGKELSAALEAKAWDVVVSDYELPNYGALLALKLVRSRVTYLPFIILSGRIGEETAVEAMRLGADDYVMKNSLTRLVPAIKRELEVNAGRRALQERDQRIRALSARAARLQEDERKMLAAELHDDVGQSLSALSINLSLVEMHIQNGSGDPLQPLRDSRHLLESIGQYVRHAVSELRPTALDDDGLHASLRLSAKAFENRAGVRCTVTASETRLPSALETALFQVAREALTNAVKHAAASRVDIVLRVKTQGGALRITDDGRGFDSAISSIPDARSHWGLVLMRERIEAVGGRLRIRSAPGQGTCVVAAWRKTR